jgi:3-mercaptopyruvate sulfurtransferase SseA
MCRVLADPKAQAGPSRLSVVSPSRLSLVSPQELQQWLQRDALLLEACNGKTQATCIPGAVLLHMEEIDVYQEDSPGLPTRVFGNYNLKSPDRLKAALEAAGVSALRPTAVYTQSFKAGAAEPIVAARLAWALAYAGVEHVALLGGGLHAWREAGYGVATEPAARPARPADFFSGFAETQPRRFPRNPHFLAMTPDVHAAIRAPSSGDGAVPAVLADVRSWREFVGEGHDYPFALPHGRIPTSRWAQWGPSTYVGGDFFSPLTGALLPLAHVRALWQGPHAELFGAAERIVAEACTGPALAAASRPRIIFYCGSGWRSSLAWCLARMMGVEDCANYDGGFLEWTMLHPDAETHPIMKGDDTSCVIGDALPWHLPTKRGQAMGEPGAAVVLGGPDLLATRRTLGLTAEAQA